MYAAACTLGNTLVCSLALKYLGVLGKSTPLSTALIMMALIMPNYAYGKGEKVCRWAGDVQTELIKLSCTFGNLVYIVGL